ncbi:tyrosine-protein phosphatase 69D isoform X2 [Plodia interpunctella]|uniref:tyrosine-protein phosphatase 69D isoform X2 n=1 Tax=Plodia interpunctella TaxID=58824 RepID=UPI0023687749|nr:tyrosine-protein phosphatase 69D isoform X2 [Plodia interpunctella]
MCKAVTSAMTMIHTDGKCPATLVLYFVCISLFCPILAWSLDIQVAAQGRVAESANVVCNITPFTATMNITWRFNGVHLELSDRIKQNIKEENVTKDEDGNPIKKSIAALVLMNVTSADAGNYTCVVVDGESELDASTGTLDLRFETKLLNKTQGPVEHNKTDTTDFDLYCIFEVYKTPKAVRWRKKDTKQEYLAPVQQLNIKTIKTVFTFNNSDPKEENENINGTYICEITDEDLNKTESGQIDVIVYDKPRIEIGNAIAISTSEIFINWTTQSNNRPIKRYTILIYNNGVKTYTDKPTPTNATSTIIRNNIKKSSEYIIEITVETDYGTDSAKFPPVKTLDEDPSYVPVLSINGFSATSVTLGLGDIPDEIAHLIHYYNLEARKKSKSMTEKVEALYTTHWRDNKNLPYMFGKLDPYSTYIFRAQACSEFGDLKRCGNWSLDKEAATLDGIPGEPKNVRIVECSSRVMNITWEPPDKPNAEIKGYTLELTGNATYIDRYGTKKEAIWGPLMKFMSNDSKSVRFDDLQPNTQYTVRLTAMTRMRRRSKEVAASCGTLQELPDSPPRPRWRKIQNGNSYVFKMYLPRISERNGPICCYRVHMIRLRPNQELKNLPPTKNISIINYEDAHAVHPMFGAYVTDIITNDQFPPDSEVVMGDGSSIYRRDSPALNSSECRRCLVKPHREPHHDSHEIFTIAQMSTTPSPGGSAAPRSRRSRNLDGDRDFTNNQILNKHMENMHRPHEFPVEVRDGPLDSGSNYTMFVELISPKSEESLYSDYVNALMPAPTPPPHAPLNILEIALQVTCGVAALVLVCMIAFCILQTRRSRKLPQAPLEMNPVFRYIVEHLVGRQPLLTQTPPAVPPVAADQLAAAYAERQLDSDYGFQKEFELLPECFNDRTTHASEARENQPKNRYPDIKAYDQTRVKLSLIDGVPGSDYINANYVSGYRIFSKGDWTRRSAYSTIRMKKYTPLNNLYVERKEFICAQGPTETTVNDFWRMIWEHGLELIVMLTNLEEYSKVKCSKYWPDELRGSRNFGSITVHHVDEKRYSDYIVRELRITKTPTNSDGQPIVENNGIAKRNGDCVGGNGSGSDTAPTSPRETKEESRLVRQYHFLMWKDFAAPEHPHSILKFIKRVNEAWSNMVGRPVVVHCSAGVGRTGTLVALDCLLEQLRATGHAAVFNTVCELRRQRNFLVQSLKQYVFVYRALVEYAHYGDTEIPASRLKAAIDRLRNTPEGADKCLMEVEFEKIINSPVTEPVKSCAAGAGEEVRNKNRSQECLPHDRNRVILTPVPGRDFSTYINASFIQAYDNSEGFIITQDPLPNTIADFWRMVCEHNVSTIVMLSELGEGKCPRYWDDGTAQYENISVQYEESESCPYYTRRQFILTDNRNGETTTVRQLQYQGWPTAAGHVPEVTRGLAELADAALPAHACPMLVHCLYGTERSSLFVALCTLIVQLRAERRADVCSVARAVRAQRERSLDTFLQYEFLHRAILNYAELHNLLEDS